MTILDHAPRMTLAQAESIARQKYDISIAQLNSLPSDRDQNFLISCSNNDKCVLKISNATEDRSFLDAQNEMMIRVAEAGRECPRVILSRASQAIESMDVDSASHFIRLVTFVEGKPLAESSFVSKPLLASVGRFIGKFTNDLDGFDHSALHREFHWDLARAEASIACRLPLIGDADLRSQIELLVARYQKNVAPIAGQLPRSAIHNDANDGNVLVQRQVINGVNTDGITGLIDFGDALFGWTIADLAVAIAYAMLKKTGSPLDTAIEIVRGYVAQRTPSEDEIDSLFGLVCMRLCLSAAIGAEQTQARPEDPYLAVSQAPIQRVLPQLADIPFRFAALALRQACGLPEPSSIREVRQWVDDHRADFAFPINPVSPGSRPDDRQTLVFDLSVESAQIGSDKDSLSEPALTKFVFDAMRPLGAIVGIGRYLEPRILYSSDQFLPDQDGECLPRTIHLGIDLFASAGTDVIAPLNGEVLAAEQIDLPLDYGGVVVLKHRADSGAEFFTIYGHLAPDSFESLTDGQFIERGQAFAQLGEPTVNGGWTPHLHFQFAADLLDLGHQFPGVARESEKAIWSVISPDPNLILGLPASGPYTLGTKKKDTLARRKRLIGSSTRLSYREPLKMVRAWRQYMFDETGRRFLDAYNNVPHVGHCHPAVVRAATSQMALLNTNTRYLHDKVLDLAERITATMPSPLSVCYFLNSASEANELAVRLARAFTGGHEMIVVDGAYHGHTTTLIEMSPYKHAGPGGSGSPDWVHQVPLADTYRGLYRDPKTSSAEYAQHVNQIIAQLSSDGRTLCGFIAESCPSVGGQIFFPENYLAMVYKQVRMAGGVCIADDVQTGYGRLGSDFYGFQLQSVVPDIVVLGKPIGNGHPLAAVMTTPGIAEAFDNGMEFFSTFGGNPVSCAAGLAVLEVLDRERLQENALQVGQLLLDELNELKDEFQIIGDVRGRGFFLGVELVRDRETREPATDAADFVVNRMRDRGILMGTEGSRDNVLKIRPPMVFDKINALHLARMLKNTLSECEL